MNEPTNDNDIDALLHLLQDPHHSRHSTALRRLVAERDSLRAEIAAAYRDRASSKSVLANVIAERVALEQQRDEATVWIACTERLPQPGQAVLVAVGKNVLRAMHAPHLTLSEDDYGEFQPQAEYDETTDRTYWPEGWYECNQFEETHWRVERDPTHWMPLPQPPREKEGGGA